MPRLRTSNVTYQIGVVCTCRCHPSDRAIGRLARYLRVLAAFNNEFSRVIAVSFRGHANFHGTCRMTADNDAEQT
jgi:hypothetical protein